MKILLLAGLALVAAAVVWRQPAAEAIVPQRPLQLSVAKPAAAAPPAATATRTVAPAKMSTLPKKEDGETPDDYVYVPPPRPRTAVMASSPAASAPARGRAVVETTVAPRATTPAAATPGYERAVAAAAALGADDLDRAARRLERITADEPSRPEAFETLAAIRLRQGDYYHASEMFASAIRHGGTATFAIMHDHTRGNFDSGPNDTCAGELAILAAGVRFDGATGHRFEASWSELHEAGSNRFFGSGIGGFHVKVAVADGKSRNFNLAPRSRDKREASLILDLLIDHAQRHDGK